MVMNTNGRTHTNKKELHPYYMSVYVADRTKTDMAHHYSPQASLFMITKKTSEWFPNMTSSSKYFVTHHENVKRHVISN